MSETKKGIIFKSKGRTYFYSEHSCYIWAYGAWRWRYFSPAGYWFMVDDVGNGDCFLAEAKGVFCDLRVSISPEYNLYRKKWFRLMRDGYNVKLVSRGVYASLLRRNKIDTMTGNQLPPGADVPRPPKKQ